MRKIILSFIAVLMSSVVFARPGPEIPIPKVTAIEAISIASDYFYSGNTKVYYKPKDYIMLVAEYTCNFGKKNNAEWAWKILFVHPKANDHSVSYKIDSKKTISLLDITGGL